MEVLAALGGLLVGLTAPWLGWLLIWRSRSEKELRAAISEISSDQAEVKLAMLQAAKREVGISLAVKQLVEYERSVGEQLRKRADVPIQVESARAAALAYLDLITQDAQRSSTVFDEAGSGPTVEHEWGTTDTPPADIFPTSTNAVLYAYKLATADARRVQRAEVAAAAVPGLFLLLFLALVIALAFSHLGFGWTLLAAAVGLVTVSSLTHYLRKTALLRSRPSVDQEHYRRLLARAGMTGEQAATAMRQATTAMRTVAHTASK